MKELNEQQRNANYLIFLQKLEKYGCKTERLNELYGERIKGGSYNMEMSDGFAFKGSLVYVTMHVMGKIAHRIGNDVFSDMSFMCPDQNSLMKVVLLSNLGKAVMFIEQTDEWWKKKGRMFTFDENSAVGMKLGVRTLYMCQECGIELTEEEYDAISCMDKDEGWSRFRTPLCAILDCVREMTAVYCRKTYLFERENK